MPLYPFYFYSMLNPNFSTCIINSCKTIEFTDETGDYDITLYPGGWGSPNITRASVTSSTVDIIDVNSVTYQIDVTTEVQTNASISFTPDQIGLASTDQIPDGQYYFKWTIYDGVDYYIVERYFFFSCVVSCGVESMIANLEIESCCSPCSGTSSRDIDKSLLAWAYLKALENAACCGKTDKFTKLLAILQRLVDENQCKSCN